MWKLRTRQAVKNVAAFATNTAERYFVFAGGFAMVSGTPFSTDVFFGPNATQIMGIAFEKACRSLHDTGQPDIDKEIIAKRIIDFAREGANDPDRLCEMTLKALGLDRSSER